MLQQAAQQAPQTWQGVVYILGALLISNGFMWLREYIKYKSEKRSNGSIEEIKKVVKNASDKVDVIGGRTQRLVTGQEVVKAELVNMKLNCASTVMGFSKEIAENRSKIFDLAKEKE